MARKKTKVIDIKTYKTKLKKYYTGKLKLSKSQLNRETFVLIVFLILMLALLIRVLYISTYQHDKYTEIVLNQATPASTTLVAKRGEIKDRNGTTLAISEKVYNVILDPKVLWEYENNRKTKEKEAGDSYIEETVQALHDYFELDKDELRNTLNEKQNSSYVILKKKLTKNQISDFESLENNYVKGVWFETDYKRQYPYNDLACNVIGYTVSDTQGQTGLEEQYSDILNGINGEISYKIDEDLKQTKTVIEAEDGSNIISTIDINIQSIVENRIKEFMDENKNVYTDGPGAKKIGVIVMNPNNGEILAMANSTSYNLNEPYDLVSNGYCTEEEANLLTDEEKLEKLNQMWRNFCISDGYEPGSTMKPITLSMALNEGILNGNEGFYCDGGQQIAKHFIKCAKRTGHGNISFDGILMFSCNDAVMQVANMIGIDTFTRYQEEFGFGSKTGIDLPGEASNQSTVYTKENMGPTELATSSFGQSFNTTMIQMISAFSATINGGVYYTPHLVKEIITNNEKDVVEVNSKQIISKEVSNIIKRGLIATIYGETDSNGNSPTAKIAKIEGYTMGGKTGTAEKLPRGNGKYLVSFIGFAPEKPELVCYVVVDEPNAEKQASSSFAQTIYKNIMEEVLPYLGLYQDSEIPEDMLDE